MGELTTSERRKLKQHEETIQNGMQSFMDVGRALLAIREEELYLETDDTFESYCKRRWQFTSRYAVQLISSMKAAEDVADVPPPNGMEGRTVVPPNEAVAREISKIPVTQKRADVWSKAVETAPIGKETGQPKVTASHVAKIRKEMVKDSPNGQVRTKKDEIALARSKATKTAEALMRALDDLNELVPKPALHKSGLTKTRAILVELKEWK